MRDPNQAPLGATAARGVGILVGRTLLLQLLTVGVTLVLGAALIRQPEGPSPRQQRAVSGFLFSTGLGFALATAAIAFAGLPALGLDRRRSRRSRSTPLP